MNDFKKQLDIIIKKHWVKKEYDFLHDLLFFRDINKENNRDNRKRKKLLIKNNMNKNLEAILQEMCRRVGADFSKMDFKKQDWYYDYTWSEEEMENFEDWLINWLYEDKKRMDGVVNFPRLHSNKKWLKRFADEFIGNYGWKTKYD